MEFLSLSRRRSSARNVPSGEERGETDVFAGYLEGSTAEPAILELGENRGCEQSKILVKKSKSYVLDYSCNRHQTVKGLSWTSVRSPTSLILG